MIAWRGFAKRFGRHEAVRSLTLTVEPGEAVALLGPNGSGKTTSIKAAAGLLRPTAGRVLIGRPGVDALDPLARRGLSYLPQRVSFPEALSGREVVEFFRRIRAAPAARTQEVLRFGALNGASARPVGTYSGGMVQRLGLAVAMIPDAPIMLLDEPTAALDPEGLDSFYGLIDRHRRAGRTLLFTSHQMGDAERLADRFAVLVDGRLAALLTGRELTARLSERGVMRLGLDHRPAGLLDVIRRLAPGVRYQGDDLMVPGPSALRGEVLERLRAAGIAVRTLTVEEGRLDGLYGELVADPPPSAPRREGAS